MLLLTRGLLSEANPGRMDTRLPAYYAALNVEERRNAMDSFGARFSKTDYIKVDIDFSSGDTAVVITTEIEGVPFTVTGTITWDEGE